MCGLDFTHPQDAFDACLVILANTPNWVQLLAYGAAALSLTLFVMVMIVMLIRRWL